MHIASDSLAWFRRAAAILMFVTTAILTSGAGAQPPFTALLNDARREGALEIWLGSPVTRQAHTALLDAFQKRFKLTVRWKWVVLHAVRANTRLTVEAAAGRASADLIAGSADNVAALAARNLVRPFDWVAAFADALPGIREPTDRVMPPLRGLCLSWFDVAYGTAWNTRFLRAEDVPKRIEDFLDPKWRGRFAVSALGGSPFDLLALEFGEAAAITFVRRLIDNRPVLKAGVPAVSGAITTGEAHLGISAFTTAERARRNGEPQDFRFFDDYLPVLPLYVCVPDKAPHPNMARLFAAWLVTEGVTIVDAIEGAGRISDPTSSLGRAVKTLPAGIKLLEEHSIADIERTREISTQILGMFSGRRE